MRTENNITLISLLFVGIYILGWIFPDYWWGVHSLSFLPIYINIAFVLMLLITWYFFKLNPDSFEVEVNKIQKTKYIILSIAISFIMGYLFHNFSIAIDATGDTLRFEQLFADANNKFKQVYLDTLLSWNIIDWQNGERTVLNAAHYFSHILDVPPRLVFQWMNTICGSLYVLLTMLFIRHLRSTNIIKTISGTLFITAPFIWIFFGHMEIYAPSVLAATAFSMFLLSFLDKPNRLKLIGLFVLLYIAIKLHTGHFLLVIPFFLSLIWYANNEKKSINRFFNWKVISSTVLLPIAITGLYLYFFVFEDHKDLRIMAPLNEQLFLPLFPPPAPLDRYNMLSFAHFFDFLNMFFMLSAASLFVITTLIIFCRKHIDWNQPKLIITATTLILYLGFFFVFNPLLGMPLDMDLFSIFGPVLIIFAIILLINTQNQIKLHSLFRGVLVLSLFTIPLITVNANTHFVAKKLTSLGVRTFETYWMGAARPILVSLALYANDKDKFDNHITQLLKRLENYITDGNDIEYSELLRRIGFQYGIGFKEPIIAQNYYEKSLYYNGNNKRTSFALMETYFLQAEYIKAHQMSLNLIKANFPSHEHALRIAIHCSIMSENYSSALAHSKEYLLTKPEDRFIQSIFNRLKSGRDLENLKNLFKN